MIAAAAGAVAGLLLNTLVIEQFRGRSAITVLIATLGVALIKAGTKINYEGASGDLDYNLYNNTFGPYGAFKATPAGVEQQVGVMSAQQLATVTP